MQESRAKLPRGERVWKLINYNIEVRQAVKRCSIVSSKDEIYRKIKYTEGRNLLVTFLKKGKYCHLQFVIYWIHLNINLNINSIFIYIFKSLNTNLVLNWQSYDIIIFLRRIKDTTTYIWFF